MEYNFRNIEKKWQNQWKETGVYKVSNDSSRPKYYVLDMFPYPSGAGLHVGHPLGYIASDIYARFKRLKGYNVLHPMGYDAFGLPAEQYAIEHGVHPAVSTEQNINNFRKQLDNIGFCYDWSREIKTSDPNYYKWTQWIFLQLFKSWYNPASNKAEPIETLVKLFETKGLAAVDRRPSAINSFTADEWKSFGDKQQQEILMNYRLAYCGYGEVNWCEVLGTVLANDEVVNGVSERGGHPVIKKKLRQWYLRITDYADRLLEGSSTVEFSEAMKEMQSNWIGKSYGAEIDFLVDTSTNYIKVYTTRPDTIFGVDFLVLAPEHELIQHITTPEQKQKVEEYITYVKSRSDRERMAEKKASGYFTGAHALHPFSNKKIPVYISEYVLAGYGTGAIMAVPCGDERDYKFAKANPTDISITNIIGEAYNGEEANATKEAILQNSDFLNGMVMKDAMEVVINKLEAMGIGKRKLNYKMRDAAFSRQRYWGEPFPIIWKDGVAYPLDEAELPVELPYVESYKPGPEGEGPLANIPEWTTKGLETNTMPGYAGSSWYFLRYMDPHNQEEFCNRKMSDYWNQVDVYVGGTEHAVGHLLYSRMWTKFLYDRGWIGYDEPFKKLVNQGMITGVSQLIYRYQPKGNIESTYLTDVIPYKNKRVSDLIDTSSGSKIFKDDSKSKVFEWFFSADAIPVGEENNFVQLHIPIEFVESIRTESSEIFVLNIKELQHKVERFRAAAFYCNDSIYIEDHWYNCNEDGVKVIESLKFITVPLGEKMSKSKLNTINPDYLVEKYGADTFRMYEMFLGPVEQSKPWDTKGIEGVHRFLKKLWRLFYDDKGKAWTEEKATDAELKILHKTIKRIEEDTERFSFNTAVSAFMVCVNELSDVKCYKREILEPLLIMLTPYAPHIAEELWQALGNPTTIVEAAFPKFEASYLMETSKEYPISINGKLRTQINIDLNATQQQVEEIVLSNEVIQKWLEGKSPKKIIYVKAKMVNVVV